MSERIKLASRQTRRFLTSKVVKNLFPFEFREETQGNTAEFDYMLRNGIKPIGLVPHFCMDDFLVASGALVLNTKEGKRRPFLIPLSIHQDTGPLKALNNFVDVETSPIMTLDTRKKEKALLEKGKKVPWAEINTDTGFNRYLTRAVTVACEGGINLIAPQGGRRSKLLRFRGQPLQHLEEKALEMNAYDDLAYFSFGVEILGADDYEKFSGVNFRVKRIVTMGNLTLRKVIKEPIDKWVYREMLRLAPPSYRP